MSTLAEVFRTVLDQVEAERPITLDPFVTFDRTSEGAVKFETANIVDDLTPRVEEHLTDSSRIRIIGNDAAYFSKEGNRWYHVLARWKARGCDITYFVMNPGSREVREKLVSLQDAKGQGCFRAFSMGKIDEESKDAEVAKRWETFHFCLFEDPAQMWVELHHASGEHIAKDCFYYPPDLAGDMADYLLLGFQFDQMLERHGVSVS